MNPQHPQPPGDNSRPAASAPTPAPPVLQVDRTRLIPAMPLEDLLTPEHHARTIWQFVQGLDLTPLYATIHAVEGGPGRPATDPPILVALWLYATVEGIGSARALDYLCTHHHGFRWMWGGVSLHYHTLADFRVAHLEFLDNLLTHSVAVLLEQERVDLNRVAQDGMRVHARAGAASFWRARMARESAKAIYKERAATAECVNAQARNRGLRQLTVRGRLKVKAVALWYAVAHNVMRAVSLRVARLAQV